MAGRKRSGPYKSAAQRVAEGKLELVDPLDYLILEALPDEGTMLGGFIPLGETVRSLKTTTFKALPRAADTLGGRLRAMEVYGMTKSVVMPGESRGWQKTKLGKKTLAAWRAKNPAKEDE